LKASLGNAAGRPLTTVLLKGLAMATVVLVLAAVLAGGCRKAQVSPLVGEPAPEFSVSRLDNVPLDSSELRGKPILLEFWAPGCPACIDNIAPLGKLYGKYGERVHFLGVSTEIGVKALGRFLEAKPLPYPVVLGNRRIVEKYGVHVIPVTVLIDGSGTVRYYHAGRISLAEIDRRLGKVLAGK